MSFERIKKSALIPNVPTARKIRMIDNALQQVQMTYQKAA